VAEERAQLGRDLHDGIAPLLAGAGLTTEALRKGMTPGTDDEQDAERLASRLRNAATEIRRLAHDLQPAPVEDRGLETALSDYIATLDAPELPNAADHDICPTCAGARIRASRQISRCYGKADRAAWESRERSCR
jgi:signal transduction histidine kinase